MTDLLQIAHVETDPDALVAADGRVALVVGSGGRLDAVGRKVNSATRKALTRLLESDRWEKMKPGEVAEIGWPAGLAAEALLVAKLDRKATAEEARRAGAALATRRGKGALIVSVGGFPRAADIAMGLQLRAYDFVSHRTTDLEDAGPVTLMTDDVDGLAPSAADARAVAEGVIFTRDLVNEPSNVLTTTEFADRLVAMRDLGLEIEVLEEEQLEALGMRLLLAVGQGSAAPTKVVVMQWNGGGDDEKPLALIGKGVVFDTGGISLKPAGGMEAMTMDMGGAGVVSGVMRTLALRRAKANVVGIVGIVENMPSGTAVRPGDIVASMKGDTVEIINTDAEGRLVLADLLWYAQDRFEPAGMINLATLTGAIVVALGHENTGLFSNDDDLAGAVLAAAEAEGEGAWRMPMGQGYDDALKSRVADMMNVGGREGGAVIAAQFLRRFVRDGMPWVHLDIAGTASRKSATDLAPKGATGWGVRTLDRMVRDRLEPKG